MKHNTIEVTLTNYGTLEVVSIPVKLYRDSYNTVKLRVNAPIRENSMLKVYASDRDEAGEIVWTSATYSLAKIKGVDYSVYENYLPQEFCAQDGDLNLTFAQIVSNNGVEEILTSGTLNLYISGEGFNYNGVQISNPDNVAIQVNNIGQEVIAVKEEFDGIKESFQELDAKVENTKVPTKLSELENDVSYAKTTEENTWDKKQKFKSTIEVRSPYSRGPIVELFGSYRSDGVEVNYPYINVTPGNYGYTEEPYSLYLPKNGGYIALKSEHYTKDKTYTKEEVDTLVAEGSLNSDALLSIINDSESIVATKDGDAVKFELDADLTGRIAKSLVVPMSAPSKTELVAIDNTKSQKMIEIGTGLSLQNGVLQATGTSIDITQSTGSSTTAVMSQNAVTTQLNSLSSRIDNMSGGGSSVNVVDTLISQSTTDALSARQGNVLYNLIGDIETLLREV